jgi:NAD(P)-dependent dehydrogenase (short-subunit alcohol dehydrogenase family)
MATKQPLAVVAGFGPGLGHALAKRIAREGYNVVMIARDRARLAEFVKCDPDHLEALACDLTIADDVRRALEALCDRYGPPDCAVFNAGGLPPEKWSSMKYGLLAFEEDLRWAGNGTSRRKLSQSFGRSMC